MKTCKSCSHFIGAGDFALCCNIKYDLCYADTLACKKFEERLEEDMSIQVIRKRPGEPQELISIENSLKAVQEAVGGYIEVVTVASDLAIICDEEGRLKGKESNCILCGVDFVGTILMVGIHGDGFCDVTERTSQLVSTNEKAPAGRQPKQGTDIKDQLQGTPNEPKCQEPNHVV